MVRGILCFIPSLEIQDPRKRFKAVKYSQKTSRKLSVAKIVSSWVFLSVEGLLYCMDALSLVSTCPSTGAWGPVYFLSVLLRILFRMFFFDIMFKKENETKKNSLYID